MTRHVFISYLCGLNGALGLYWLAFRKMKRYVGLPLTLIVYVAVKNVTLRNSLDRIYYPI